MYYCETLLCELYSKFIGKDFWKVKPYWICDIKWLTDWVTIHRQYKISATALTTCNDLKQNHLKREESIYCYFTYSMLKLRLEFRHMPFLILCVALEHTHTYTHTHTQVVQFSITVRLRILHFQERKEFLFLCPVKIVFQIGAENVILKLDLLSC